MPASYCDDLPCAQGAPFTRLKFDPWADFLRELKARLETVRTPVSEIGP
jgi:hypothetical protein